MNIYKKYCPNVFVAQCEEEYQKGDTIMVETKYGKENEHVVHNLLGQKNGLFFYSITRADGFNNQERAKKQSRKNKKLGRFSRKKKRCLAGEKQGRC